MNIPARYRTGYLGDICMPKPWPAGHFPAWFEAAIRKPDQPRSPDERSDIRCICRKSVPGAAALTRATLAGWDGYQAGSTFYDFICPREQIRGSGNAEFFCSTEIDS
jgi:hypothetical protein